MAFLAGIKGGVDLKATDVNDRSAANLENATPDVLDNEHERWEYFFNSGCRTWFDLIKDHTFTSTFCTLDPSEARVIVEHWEARRRLIAAASSRGEESEPSAELDALLTRTLESLGPLKQRLDAAVAEETAKSSEGKAFVKLSTRSPKDSKKALARAKASYHSRLAALDHEADDNERWVMVRTLARPSTHRPIDPSTHRPIDPPPTDPPTHRPTDPPTLSEEVTKSSAIANGDEALELLLDSDRVYEDLEYALRGPPAPSEPSTTGGAAEGATDAAASSSGGSAVACQGAVAQGAVAHPPGGEVTLSWNMELVARAWDPRLTPESEYRGIAWNGELSCLCQYFHPLYFPGMRDRSEEVQRDIMAVYNSPEVKNAVARLGGHCIIDFAWLGPGEVIVIELNPFDGVCLGTFPASTGLFLWDEPADKLVMMGEAPFEFRMRDAPLEAASLRVQCNQDWRAIVHPSPTQQDQAA
eukprot:CAMPEP_0182599926 /NCGR_PEP_ID=MMETSP1324-20130603/90619_1 /TAXON_ID=236786 /ORGANISM="Florenciella sp., Strain RCC1587" /LENGTH=470 /DNA_ID=CAMNT_0024817833 /DNA_START=109 /DNA_END=1522 /DNA_ORIENTATION=+